MAALKLMLLSGKIITTEEVKIQKGNTTPSMTLKSDFFFFYINDAIKIAIKSCGSGSPSFPLES